MSPLVDMPPPNICKKIFTLPSKLNSFRFQESRQLGGAETLLVLTLKKRQRQPLLSPISHQRLHTLGSPVLGLSDSLHYCFPRTGACKKFVFPVAIAAVGRLWTCCG